MPAPIARRGEPNYDLFDRYTLGHGAAGVLLELARVPWWATLILAVGWEFAERPLKDVMPNLFPVGTQDTVQNALGDVIGVMAGWALARVVSSI
jgi:hypothetical protein